MNSLRSDDFLISSYLVFQRSIIGWKMHGSLPPVKQLEIGKKLDALHKLEKRVRFAHLLVYAKCGEYLKEHGIISLTVIFF